jgi:hypothetical protein
MTKGTMSVIRQDPLAMDSSDYPLKFDVLRQDKYKRWLPLLKPMLALPHALLLVGFGVSLFPFCLASAVIVTVTGRYPRKVFRAISGWLLWNARFLAYVCLLTDSYPPYSFREEAGDTVKLQLHYPPAGRVAHWRPLGAWVLVLGQLLFLPIVYSSLALMVALGFFSILFTQVLPSGVFDFIVRALRFNVRLVVYCLFMTERYPGFSMR